MNEDWQDEDWLLDMDEPVPWCEMHDAPHTIGGFACELRSEESLAGTD